MRVNVNFVATGIDDPNQERSESSDDYGKRLPTDQIIDDWSGLKP